MKSISALKNKWCDRAFELWWGEQNPLWGIGLSAGILASLTDFVYKLFLLHSLKSGVVGTMLTNEDYKYKIVNASATRLVIVTYEIIEDRLVRAKTCLAQKNTEELSANVNNARQFVNELICSLDMDQPVSQQMADLYIFVNRLIITGYFKKQKKYFDSAYDIINKLKTAFLKEVDDNVYESLGGVLASESYSNVHR